MFTTYPSVLGLIEHMPLQPACDFITHLKGHENSVAKPQNYGVV